MKHNEASELLYFATFELHHCMASLFFRHTFPTWTSRWSTWASCPFRWAFLCRSFQQCRWRRGQLMIVYCISLQFLSSQEGAESQSANPEKDQKTKLDKICEVLFCGRSHLQEALPFSILRIFMYCARILLSWQVRFHAFPLQQRWCKQASRTFQPSPVDEQSIVAVVDWQTLTHFSLRWGFQGHRIPLGRLEDFAQPGTMSRVAVSLCAVFVDFVLEGSRPRNFHHLAVGPF